MLVAVVLAGAAMVTTATGSASASSAWSNRSNLPQGVGDGAAATAPCVGDLSANCAYIVGGRNFASNGLTATDQYDVASNQWTSVASLSIGRYQSGASAGPCLSDQTKTCVYAVGGTDSDGSFLNSVEVFNPASDAWGTGPTVPTPNAPSNFTGRSQLATAAGPCFTDTAQTCIYAIGGYNQALYNLATVEMLNPSTGTWTNAASLNTARSRLAAAAAPCVGNGAHTCLYAIGGTGTNGFLS